MADEANVDPATESSMRPGAGRWWIVGLGLSAIILVCFGGTLRHLAHRWANEPDYSHGFLVPVFAAYLLWYRRDLLRVGTGGRGT